MNNAVLTRKERKSKAWRREVGGNGAEDGDVGYSARVAAK